MKLNELILKYGKLHSESKEKRDEYTERKYDNLSENPEESHWNELQQTEAAAEMNLAAQIYEDLLDLEREG